VNRSCGLQGAPARPPNARGACCSPRATCLVDDVIGCPRGPLAEDEETTQRTQETTGRANDAEDAAEDDDEDEEGREANADADGEAKSSTRRTPKPRTPPAINNEEDNGGRDAGRQTHSAPSSGRHCISGVVIYVDFIMLAAAEIVVDLVGVVYATGTHWVPGTAGRSFAVLNDEPTATHRLVVWSALKTAAMPLAANNGTTKYAMVVTAHNTQVTTDQPYPPGLMYRLSVVTGC